MGSERRTCHLCGMRCRCHCRCAQLHHDPDCRGRPRRCSQSCALQLSPPVNAGQRETFDRQSKINGVRAASSSFFALTDGRPSPPKRTRWPTPFALLPEIWLRLLRLRKGPRTDQHRLYRRCGNSRPTRQQLSRPSPPAWRIHIHSIDAASPTVGYCGYWFGRVVEFIKQAAARRMSDRTEHPKQWMLR